MLDQPGGYFNRSTRAVLHPATRRTPEDLVAVALGPAIIDVRGTPDQPVQHLSFAGLTIAHATSSSHHKALMACGPRVFSSRQPRTINGHARKKVAQDDHSLPIAPPGSLTATGWQQLHQQRRSAPAAYGIRSRIQDITISTSFKHLGGGGIRIGEQRYCRHRRYGKIDPASTRPYRPPPRITLPSPIIISKIPALAETPLAFCPRRHSISRSAIIR